MKHFLHMHVSAIVAVVLDVVAVLSWRMKLTLLVRQIEIIL